MTPFRRYNHAIIGALFAYIYSPFTLIYDDTVGSARICLSILRNLNHFPTPSHFPAGVPTCVTNSNDCQDRSAKTTGNFAGTLDSLASHGKLPNDPLLRRVP